MTEVKTIKLKVHVEIYGKPRFKIGAWLIKLGAKIAKVHAKVWVEEQSARTGAKLR